VTKYDKPIDRAYFEKKKNPKYNDDDKVTKCCGQSKYQDGMKKGNKEDWKLIEDKQTTIERIKSGIDLINNGYDCIRYRHRKEPGHPHFSFKYQGRELEYYDKEIECTSPHLLDSVHWCDPFESFPQHIGKEGEYFTTTSRYGNWTNNPCLYKKDFYLETVKQFAGDGIALEGNISKWWAQQTFKVAHGEGLFCHLDEGKHGR